MHAYASYHCKQSTVINIINPSLNLFQDLLSSAVPNLYYFCRASAAYAIMWCPSVCVSVLSRSWIVSKPVIVSSKFFHHRVTKPF